MIPEEPTVKASPATKASPVFDIRNFGWETTSKTVPNNLEQALTNAGLNWMVTRKPVRVDGKKVPDRWANVRSDLPPGQNVLEIVKSKYSIVQNIDALGFVQDVLNMGNVTLERAGSINGGRTVFLLASTRKIRINGDTIAPYLLFSNSHDGSSSVRVCLTTFRIECANTLPIALANSPRIWSVQHTKSAEKRMKEAQKSMQFIEKYLTVYPMFVDRLMETKISEAGFARIADTLFPIPVATETNTKKVESSIEARNTFEQIYDETPDLDAIRGTAWGVYNAYSDYVSHKQAIRQTENYEMNRFIGNFVGRNLEFAQQIILNAAAVA
jgi:phage/plasmid-like protein (TIGR03299 family)